MFGRKVLVPMALQVMSTSLKYYPMSLVTWFAQKHPI